MPNTVRLPDSIRIASYNIHKAVGTDRRRNPERIMGVLAEIDADIVVLQEADRRFGARAAALPPTMLELHSVYRPAPLNIHNDSIGWHGNAILIRKSAQLIRSDIIHLPCLEPRGAVVAEIHVNGRNLRIIGMHLDLSGLWRRRQAATIVHAHSHMSDMPTIIAGDLNEWSTARGCLTDFARHFQFADTGKSFHARQPVARLDRIMHCAQLKTVAAAVHHTMLARRASDHLPIWADFIAR